MSGAAPMPDDQMIEELFPKPIMAVRRRSYVECCQWDGSDGSAEVINEWACAYVVDFKRDESKQVQLWVAANDAWVGVTPWVTDSANPQKFPS